MKFTEKQQLIGILVGAGLLIIGEVAFAWFSFSDRGAMAEELAALDARQVAAQAKIEQIPDLQKKARDLSEIVEQYTEILPREDEVSPDAFLDDISTLAREVGLEITSAQPIEVKQQGKNKPRRRSIPGKANAPAEPPKSFVRHKYRFEMVGEVPSLRRFINGVENQKRFLQVDRLEIAPLAAGNRGSKKDELELAQVARKSVTVEVSTYTYSRMPQDEEVK